MAAKVSTILAASLSAAVAPLALAQPQITVIGGFSLQSWDAGYEVPNRTNWHSEAPAASWPDGLRWNWQENTLPDGTGDVIPPDAVCVFDPSAPGITGAYQFPAARAVNQNGNTWENQAPAGQSGTFELWFKPSDLSGTHVLWEIGAENKGVALVLEDDELVYLVRATDGAGGNEFTYEHRETIAANQWYQAAIVVSFSDFIITSYLDGAAVNSAGVPVSATYRWSSANPAGLGTIGSDPAFPTVGVAGGTIPAANFTDYDGMIAILRFYNVDLFANEVLNNFEAITDADALTRRSDYNGDGMADTMDQLDLVTFFDNSTVGTIPTTEFPFPSNPVGGVQMNDPANEQPRLGDFHWNRDNGFNPPNASPNQEPTFQFPSVNVLTPVPVLDPAIPSVRTAFVLNGAEAFRGPKFEQADDGFNAARVQFWLHVEDLTGNHCLFEAGGSGVGFALYSVGSELIGTINSAANDGLDIAEITSGTGVLTTGWHLFEIVVRRTISSGIGEGFELYLDGAQVAALNDLPGPDLMIGTADDINQISVGQPGGPNSNFIGGNQSGYGQIQGSSPLPAGFVAGDFTPFNGLAGPFRLATQQPAPAEVMAQYLADQGQDIVNARNDLNKDGEANFFDVLEGLTTIDAGR